MCGILLACLFESNVVVCIGSLNCCCVTINFFPIMHYFESCWQYVCCIFNFIHVCFALFAGRKFWIIGGQHSVAVCIERRDASLKAGKSLPDWQKVALCSALKHDVPLSVRQAEAGNAQYRQGNVSALPLSATMQLFLQETEAEPQRGVRQNLAVAVQKSGAARQDKLVCTVVV